MKRTIYIFSILCVCILGCANSVEFSEEFKDQTSGKYLYNMDDVIEVYYTDNQPFLKWRGGTMEPVVVDTNEFFVADMYDKLRFVQHPETGERYLSIIPKENPDSIRYDYLKVSNDYKTPSTYLKEGNFAKAQEGFLAIKAKDSTTTLFNEREFNSRGYRYLRDKKYDDAISVFKMNVALFPESDNVYDSLADAYLRSGDSAKAYSNYVKAYELNTGNDRAKAYIEAYSQKEE
ncbi:tetratricopeptide repeat protein [Winogradskyella sp. A3E31]|uniref:tetratricopeptide repeat protein n=1 Tax=Winogradskyella sp. A3E31 TaxID=3349637 RepID=UPI00398B474A